MTTQVNFNIDTDLKRRAMRKADKEGVTLSFILQSATKAYVDGSINFGLVEKFNPKAARRMRAALKDIEAGKNLAGPFYTAAEAMRYLNRRK